MRFRITRPKLGIRTTSLILGFVAVCVVLGWKAVDGAKRQSAVVSRVSRTHGTSKYRFSIQVPPWFVDRLGPELFARVTTDSHFEGGAYPPDDPENYCNYRALHDLPHLEEIEVFDSAFPLEVLKDIPALQRLAILQNGMRDDDMNVISGLRGLQTLSLRDNDITDSGAQRLSLLHNLTELDLSGNFVSAEAISELQRSMPHCRIKNDWSRADTPKSSNTVATEPSGEPELPITRVLNP